LNRNLYKNYLIHNIDFLIESSCLQLLSDDPEIEKIKQRKLEEMIRQQNQPQIQPGIIDLNDTNFTQIISAENPTLVDFWAEWCGPCKMMHPVFESLSKKYPKIKFARVNVDQNQNIAMKFAVQSIPMFIMFKSGQIVDKMIGAVGAPGIHMICKKYSD
jgi:thioredoxin 1